MPHFIAAGHTKYALDALKLQMQVNATLSPNLAHQVMWNRFVNTRGGGGGGGGWAGTSLEIFTMNMSTSC